MIQILGYAAKSKRSNLRPIRFERRDAGADDVEIDVLYCGVCHSDLHQVRNEWRNTVYPCLPGHEIVGRVARVGSRVTRHAVGDLVGVGCMVDSCGQCRGCRDGLEQYCEGPHGATMTYNGPMKPDGTNTFGGYSDKMVVRESFVLKIPAGMAPELAAPLLCAGVTTLSPMRRWGVTAGTEVAIIGLGGLGHVATQLAKALGARVTVFTTSPDKRDDARELGVDRVVIWKRAADLEEHELGFDFVLHTLPDPYDPNPFVKLVKRDGTLVVCGMLATFTEPLDHTEMAFHRRQLAGTLIGGIAETQETLDFCAAHGVVPRVQVIPIQEIDAAFEQMQDGEVRFRYVIDLASLASDR